ncbi:MAG: Crp/Fnr family transcriptional regulator [Anaerolineae bacterium]|nr:Crp/Fnr family transcriptional regulator [Anaerolineae bacterium]NUQ05647.1 Crp/Fnr family transcriptional regulator [Anaerolineae bacterium]
MTVNADLLAKSRIFAALSPRTQRSIAEEARLVEFSEHVDLYHQGDPPAPLFILQTGRVKLYRQSKENCQILALPIPGDCLGAESLPTGAASPYSATTLTPTLAVTLSPEILQVLMDEHPDFQEMFLRLITERLKQFVTLVHDLAFRDVTSRLATVLLARADTEGQAVEGGILFERLLSQQEFADMVGTAREVVYRTFKRLEDDGLISLSRYNILIRDPAALRAISQQETR